jgi:phosphoribosylglycinamide formyltransferase
MPDQNPKETRITVLISGSGTNLQALIDDKDSKLQNSTIIRVISNRKAAYGLTRAQKAGIPTTYHNLVAYKKKFGSSQDSSSAAKGDEKAREEYDKDLAKLVLADGPDLVVCAGFMHILSPGFLEPLEESGVRIINLHPGMVLFCLLPHIFLFGYSVGILRYTEKRVKR